MPRALRIALCGSVDDGKSTLIGRILYDCRQVFADQMRSVEADSRRYGTQGDAADLALLVDGLRDEREQGISIDVAYRAFETPLRRFLVAAAPTLPGQASLARGARDRHSRLAARTSAKVIVPLPVADRPFGVRQVHDRQPPREAPRLRGAPHLPAGWRQRPPRSQPGPGLHRDRPRREHPQGGRGVASHGRRRVDRDRVLHQSLPVRTRLRPRTLCTRRLHGDLSWMRRSRRARGVTRRASTPRR